MSWWRKKTEFHLLELLGEGGQGRVYRALRLDRSSGLSQAVAIKILHSKTAVELWRNEFESLARVRSPYCVQVLSFERIRGQPSLVLELVDGISGSELTEAGALSEAALTELLAQIQCGLQDLAAQGLFHGDLSPQNILVDVNGNVRLLDFGLANGSGTKLRLTPAFAAPERLRGSPADFASDLFSLGRLEQYWRGLERTHEEAGPYLRLLPSLRELLPHKPDLERQKELALAVRKAKRRQKLKASLQTKTQSHMASKTKRTAGSQTLTAAMLLFPIVFSGAAQSHWMPPSATLNLSTERWHYFYIDGTPQGYAPLTLHLSAEQDHTLKWISTEGSGSRQIHLSKDQTAHLSDRDFSH